MQDARVACRTLRRSLRDMYLGNRPAARLCLDAQNFLNRSGRARSPRARCLTPQAIYTVLNCPGRGRKSAETRRYRLCTGLTMRAVERRFFVVVTLL